MELEQAGDDSAVHLRLSVNLGKEFGGVNSVNETDERGYVFYLVGLEVPNEVPLNVLRKRLCLLPQFLCTAFAKDALPGSVGFGNGLYGMIL